MNYDNSKLNDELVAIYTQNQYQIENELAFEQRKQFEKKLKKLNSDSIKITLGGPVQTILTGLIGLVILLFRRRKIKTKGVKIIDWLAVFLSLFWLREIFNLIHSIAFAIILKEESYFGGDEKFISEYFNLGSGTIPIITGIIGFVISLYVIFKILPKQFKLPFIVSGLIGSTTGFLLWFQFIGPILIP